MKVNNQQPKGLSTAELVEKKNELKNYLTYDSNPATAK